MSDCWQRDKIMRTAGGAQPPSTRGSVAPESMGQSEEKPRAAPMRRGVWCLVVVAVALATAAATCVAVRAYRSTRSPPATTGWSVIDLEKAVGKGAGSGMPEDWAMQGDFSATRSVGVNGGWLKLSEFIRRRGASVAPSEPPPEGKTSELNADNDYDMERSRARRPAWKPPVTGQPKGILLWGQGRSGSSAFWESLSKTAAHSKYEFRALCKNKEPFSLKPLTRNRFEK